MRKLLIENKENTDKHILIEASRNTSEDIQRINESLRKLSKRAEISINYRHLPYEQLRYTNLPNPNVSKFTPDVNVIYQQYDKGNNRCQPCSKYLAKDYQRHT